MLVASHLSATSMKVVACCCIVICMLACLLLRKLVWTNNPWPSKSHLITRECSILPIHQPLSNIDHTFNIHVKHWNLKQTCCRLGTERTVCKHSMLMWTNTEQDVNTAWTKLYVYMQPQTKSHRANKNKLKPPLSLCLLVRKLDSCDGSHSLLKLLSMYNMF